MATAAVCLAVVPVAHDATAHADGPAGATARRDRGAALDAGQRAGRRDGHRRGGRYDAGYRAGRATGHEHGRHDGHGSALPPRTRIIFDGQSPRGQVAPGGTYEWPYTVTNPGPAPARDVALTARPDRHLKVVATPPKCHWTGHNNLVCRIGLIPAGQTRKGSFTARVDKNAPAGHKVSNPVRLSWDGRPDSAARYSGFPPVTVSPRTAPATDLAVTSTVPQTTDPDGDIPYEVSVTNEGPVTAEGVIVRSAVADQPPGSPCSVLAPVGVVVRKVTSVLTPALPPCAAGHDRPAGPAAAAQCGTLPGLNSDRPVILPCAVSGAGEAVRSAVPACPLPHAAGEAPPCAARHSAVPACPLPHAAGEAPPCAARQQPGKSVAITPESAQIVPGVPPAHDVPAMIGKHRCVSQGAGFVCPIGDIPPGRTRTIRLAVHARPHAPHRLRCLSSVASGTPDRNPGNNAVDCHTRAARPMTPHENLAVHRLPRTGFAYGLVGLCGAGLIGLGFVLHRMSRTRRRRGQAVVR